MSKKLFTNSFIFVLGDVLNKAVPFFMLPVLTRYLTPSDYGMISMFSVLIGLFSVFVGMSVHGSININFFKLEKEKLRVFIGNCLLILNVSTLFIIFLIFAIKPQLVMWTALPSKWILIAVVLAAAQFLTTINLLLWTAEQNPKKYSLYQLTQTFVTTSLVVVFVVGIGMKWEGQLIAMSIGTILFSTISMIFIWKRGYLILRPNNEYIKDALQFGIPLIPHSLAGWASTSIDRVMIMSSLGAALTGIYSISYQLGMILGILTAAFNKAWIPYLYNILSSEPSMDKKKKLVKYTYMYFAAILGIAVLFSYLVNLLVPYFLGEKFIEASEYVIYFAFAFAFNGMYFMVTNYIFYVQKTYILAMITFFNAGVHFLLLVIFLKYLGIKGAAIAMMISYFLTFIMTWMLSQKVYPMPWRLKYEYS